MPSVTLRGAAALAQGKVAWALKTTTYFGLWSIPYPPPLGPQSANPPNPPSPPQLIARLLWQRPRATRQRDPYRRRFGSAAGAFEGGWGGGG